ncbi:MAG TPA: GAF domain-containing protein [Frankiaceae bacterium]|nr:GAF domain-containing protein [Frankiaceae bacterium]
MTRQLNPAAPGRHAVRGRRARGRRVAERASLRGPALPWRTPGDPRRRAGRLAGALYLVAAVEVAVRTAFLPASTPRGVLLGTAVALWVGGAVMIVLPWQRWPYTATVLPVLWAWFAFAAAAGAVAGRLHHFLPLYAVAFLYVGLTQRAGASAALAVPALLAAGIAVTGAQPAATLPDLVAAIGVGAAVGELVAWFRRRQECTTAGLEQVLDVAGELLVCDDVPAVLDRITSRTRSLLRADGAVLYLADPDRPSYYVSQALALRAPADPAYAHLRHPLVLEVDAEPTGIGTAVREGRAVFVRDARGDPYVAARYLRAVTVGSALYVPMLGQRGPLGGIAVWWRREQDEIDRVAARVVDLSAGRPRRCWSASARSPGSRSRRPPTR